MLPSAFLACHGQMGVSYCGRNKSEKIRIKFALQFIDSGKLSHMLLDTTSRHEHGTTIIARELACHQIDIATLSETRPLDESYLEEVGAGYTFFGLVGWSKNRTH